MKNRAFYIRMGFFCGILNGLFGAGGGMVAAPMLKTKLKAHKAHATSIAIILPLSAFSALLYYLNGDFSFQAALPYLPLGLCGALIGTKLLRKIRPKLLRRLFGVLILLSAVRLLVL